MDAGLKSEPASISRSIKSFGSAKKKEEASDDVLVHSREVPLIFKYLSVHEVTSVKLEVLVSYSYLLLAVIVAALALVLKVTPKYPVLSALVM